MDHQQIDNQVIYSSLALRIKEYLKDLPEREQATFLQRLELRMTDILYPLLALYHDRPDFSWHLENIVLTAAQYYRDRSASLKELDYAREAERDREGKYTWFHSEKMMGAVCYVDRFAGADCPTGKKLQAVQQHIDYLEELGITYLHLMPLFLSPQGNNDGGFAVSSYRMPDPDLGTIEDLRNLATDLRERGISLVLDFVFNHTADDHEWAQKALAGDTHYQNYYFMFPDRTLPDHYEVHLREIFPDQAPGNFTYREEVERWVWTTFNRFQWDLNYANPHVFREMLGELLFLANIGAEVLRLDAVVFIWKQMGTNCEFLPQTHHLIRAFYALVQVVAPAVIFKSEAIVDPSNVMGYFGDKEWSGKECQLSYNPLLMVSLWDALATRKVNLMYRSLAKYYDIYDNCAWVNYVRCHDDIGWGLADDAMAELGMSGYDHRLFLNAFFTGSYAIYSNDKIFAETASFARGLPFNYNPKNRDMRISGTCASLCGLEAALESRDYREIDFAIKRIVLIHSIILSIGGIPLLYLNDEYGVLNDYTYENDPHTAEDNRWVHRPYTDWTKVELRTKNGTVENRIFSELKKLIHLRKSMSALTGGKMKLIYTGHPHLFAYTRGIFTTHEPVLIVANFSEQRQTLYRTFLSANGLSQHAKDRVSGMVISGKQPLALEPYQFMWISREA